MNYYYISAEIAENMPDYNFVLKAKTCNSAVNKAFKIIKADYGDYFNNDKHIEKSYSCELIEDTKDFIKKLTLN